MFLIINENKKEVNDIEKVSLKEVIELNVFNSKENNAIK